MNNDLNNRQESVATKGDWSAGRKLRIALNVALMIIIALGILVGVNYLSARHYIRKDITFTREFALSDKTKNVLAHLSTPITIYLLFAPPELSGLNPRIIVEAQARLRDLLEEYKSYSEQISWEEVRFIENPGLVEALRQKLKLETHLELNDIIMVAENREKIIKIDETYETDVSSPWQPATRIESFKGEATITEAILNVTQAKKRIIGFLTGHGEADIYKYATEGYSTLNSFLQRDNMETKKIDLVADSKSIDQCDVLVIGGPSRMIPSGEWDLINAFLEKDGRALIMIDPNTKTGLEKYLATWGVKVNNDIVIDPEHCALVVGKKNIWWIAANGYSRRHPVTRKMPDDLYTAFPIARSIEPVEKPDASLTIITLIDSSHNAWGETNIESILQSKIPKYTEGKDKKGPLTLGVAVTKTLTPTGETRLVVFGDADLIRNGYINPMSSFYLNTPDLIMNSFRWLTQAEELISIEPKKARELRIDLTPARLKWLFWLTVVGLPVFSILLGVFVWLRRRK